MSIIATLFWVNSNAFPHKQQQQQWKRTKKQNQTEKEMSEVLNTKDIYRWGQCISFLEGLEIKSQGKEWYFLLIIWIDNFIVLRDFHGESYLAEMPRPLTEMELFAIKILRITWHNNIHVVSGKFLALFK